MKRSRGFTLIEIAVVTVVVALLLGSILVPLVTQVENRRSADTRQTLEDIREAIIGYALSRPAGPHLPCPDKTTGAGAGTANDGVEDVEAGGTCTVAEGNVPWQTLGMPPADAWGARFRYRATLAFAQRSPATPTFQLTSVGDITVCGVAACGAGNVLASGVPALLLSHGRNGYGATAHESGTARPVVPAGNTDEAANTNNDTTFVSRTSTETVAAGSTEFDDVVVWLPVSQLMNRMVVGGRLP